MEAAEVLAMVGGHVDEELLLRNEYLAAENEILKSKIEGPVRLTDPERIRLAKTAKRLGRKALEGVPCTVRPDTLLRWYRDLVARKFDGSKQRRGVARRNRNPNDSSDLTRWPFTARMPRYGHLTAIAADADLAFALFGLPEASRSCP